MTDTLEAFRNRFFAFDTRTYDAGTLPVKTKGLLGDSAKPSPWLSWSAGQL